MTPIESGDPRLTAYVLGELTAIEALEVEAWLFRSPETRAEVQGIRNMIGLLQEGFAAELATSLAAPIQEVPSFSVVRPSPQELAIGIASTARRPRRAWGAGIGLAAAAAIAVAFASPQWFSSTGAKVVEAPAELPHYLGSVPGAGGVSSFGEGEGIFLASSAGELLHSKPVGADPVITEVRFLSDDSTALGNFPLTPEMVSYLPVSRTPGAVPSSNGPFYLDADRFPDPKIVPTHSVNEWEEARLMSSLSASIAIGQERPSQTLGRAGRLLDAGRQLFLAGEYEAAAAVFEKAIGELPESVAGADPLREQIEAFLNASRNMRGSIGR